MGYQKIAPDENYPHSSHPVGYVFNPDVGRVIDEFAIIYVEKGKGTFKSASCKKKNVLPGTLLFLFPGEWHTYKPLSSTGWEERWVGCVGNIPNTLIENNFFKKTEPVLTIGYDERLLHLFDQLFASGKKQDFGFQFKVAGIISDILGHCSYLQQSKSIRNTDLVSKINLAKTLIYRSLQIKPEQLAQEVEMGYTWFRRVFKDYTGLSPAQYIVDLKLQLSKQLLTETNKSMIEISQELGFESDYYFTAFFKKNTGQTPLKYRNQKFF